MSSKQYRITIGNNTYEATLHEQGTSGAEVHIGNHKVLVELAQSPAASVARQRIESEDPNVLSAALPGRIEEINVRAGSAVKSGDELIVMNSMKMRVAICAPKDAVVKEVLVEPNSVVAKSEPLIVLAAADE